jgi:transposase
MEPSVTPSTADFAALRADNLRLQHQNDELLRTITQIRAELDQRQATIERLMRIAFGRRSERLEGPTLFDACAAPIPPPAPEPPVTPEPITTTPVKKRKGHGRKPLPENLPHERFEIDLTEPEKLCPCCGKPRIRIGADTSERLDYRPACLFIRETVRPKYGCSACEAQDASPQIVMPPLPPEPIPRGIAASGLLAHLLVSKYLDHLPLYRLESIFERLGWNVSRSTLCDLVMQSAGVLQPLYEEMMRRVLLSAVLHTDDTSLTLLAPLRTAHAWVYVGDALRPYTVFDLSVGRREEFPQAVLKGYKGFLQADGYSGYDAIYAAGATHVGCWAHARRYFYDARLSSPELAHDALGRIRALYAVEAQAKELKLADAELAVYRQEHAGPVLTAFGTWLLENSRKALPKSPLGQAFTYATNQWPTLQVYVSDGRLVIDNHPAEQAIRPLAIGRNNWLHIAADGGMTPAAVLLSLAASAKRHGVNPWDYFKHILNELPARPPDADLTDLLPDEWAKARTRLQPSA